PSRPRSRHDHRTAISLRRARAGRRLSRGAGAAPGCRRRHAARMAADAAALSGLPPQQRETAVRGGGAARRMARDAAHARNPSFDTAGGDELELFEPALVLGSPACEPAARCATGRDRDRGRWVSESGGGDARGIARDAVPWPRAYCAAAEETLTGALRTWLNRIESKVNCRVSTTWSAASSISSFIDTVSRGTRPWRPLRSAIGLRIEWPH